MAFSVMAGLNGTVQASCGDWLQHSEPQSTVETSWPNKGAPAGPNCRGPGCSRSPLRENSTPAVPISWNLGDRHWAVWLDDSSPELELVGRAALADEQAAILFPPRLERPPQG